MNNNTKPMDHFERDQLWSIGNSVYGDGRPYWWGEAERKLVWRERIAKGDTP